MTVRVGVIGTGKIGSDHVVRLSRHVVGATVTGVFDVATDRAAVLAASLGATAHRTWQDVVRSGDVDAVLVASPGDLHAEQTTACITAGKPVLCEKPLATSGQDALHVAEAEVAAGRRLVQVGFMRRYDRGYLDVHRAVSDGRIGTPLLAHAVHRNVSVPGSFRGEMALTDSVVHEFDVFRWLLGTEIEAVTVVPVRSNPAGPSGLRDPQVVVVEMRTGEVVTVESFVTCGYGYDVRCEVVGSHGTVSLENPRTAVVRSGGTVAEPVPADWQERFDPAYLDELVAWVDGLAAGRVDGPSAWDGYVATVTAEAAVASYRKGERVEVELVDRPGLYR